MLTLNTKSYRDGIVTLSAENAAHPLVQEYFTRIGATLRVTDEGRIVIKGPIQPEDIQFGNFLTDRGVNLTDPHALDTPVPKSLIIPAPTIPSFPRVYESRFNTLTPNIPTSSTLPLGANHDLPRLPSAKHEASSGSNNVEIFNTMLLTGMLVYMAYKFIIKPIARRFNASYDAYNDYLAQPKVTRTPHAGGNTLSFTEQPVSFLGWLMGTSHASVDLVASTAKEIADYEAAQTANSSATTTTQRPHA